MSKLFAEIFIFLGKDLLVSPLHGFRCGGEMLGSFACCRQERGDEQRGLLPGGCASSLLVGRWEVEAERGEG